MISGAESRGDRTSHLALAQSSLSSPSICSSRSQCVKPAISAFFPQLVRLLVLANISLQCGMLGINIAWHDITRCLALTRTYVYRKRKGGEDRARDQVNTLAYILLLCGAFFKMAKIYSSDIFTNLPLFHRSHDIG